MKKVIILHIIQYLLITLIILTGQIVPKQIPFLFLFLIGLLVIFLSLTTKNSGKQKNILYSTISMIGHPFLAAMLLMTLALVLDLYTYERLMVWIVLFIVVLMRIQEKRVVFKKSKKKISSKPLYRLIPFIY